MMGWDRDDKGKDWFIFYKIFEVENILVPTKLYD
jgi:hypothetical protein